jgi:predicted nucleic acid-binding Zn ribbon protein
MHCVLCGAVIDSDQEDDICSGCNEVLEDSENFTFIDEDDL